MQQEIENGNFKTMKRTCTKFGRDVTLGSRGCFFLIFTDRSRQSRVNQARSAESQTASTVYFILGILRTALWSKGREMSDLKEKNWLEKWKVFMLEA